METRVAVISIVVESPEAVEPLNQLLHSYAHLIIGRMGIPYTQKNINIICIAIDAPVEQISALNDSLDRIEGVSADAVLSRS